MRKTCVSLFLTLLWTIGSFGQTPASRGATPQHQLMNYFQGNWKIEGTMKVNPLDKPLPFTVAESSNWVNGGFFLETHSQLQGPLGAINSVRVMEYNAQKQAYAYNAYNSAGEHIVAVGQLQGNDWVWQSVANMDGIDAKGRWTFIYVSPTSYKFKQERATPSGTWDVVMEGVATRAAG